MDFVSILPCELLSLMIQFLDVSSKYSLSCASTFYAQLNDKMMYQDDDFTPIIIYVFSLSKKKDIVAMNAISNGYTNLFKWLMVSFICSLPNLYAKIFCNNAAISGSLDILKYIHENGMLNTRSLSFGVEAVKGGNLETVKWLYKIGCPLCVDGYTYAAKHGHLEILKWLYQNNQNKQNKCAWYTTYICESAAEGGHLDVLKWLRSKVDERYWNSSVCNSAAANGHLEVLKYLRTEFYKNGCPLDKLTCSYAAKGGHFDVLKWLHQNGWYWDEWTCRNAAKGGHFDILNWLRTEFCKNGCPWDECVCYDAAVSGHLEILNSFEQSSAKMVSPCSILNCEYCTK